MQDGFSVKSDNTDIVLVASFEKNYPEILESATCITFHSTLLGALISWF